MASGGDKDEEHRGEDPKNGKLDDASNETESQKPKEDKEKAKQPSLLLSDLYEKPPPRIISLRELKGLLALLVEFGGTFGTAAVIIGYFTHIDPFGGFHW